MSWKHLFWKPDEEGGDPAEKPAVPAPIKPPIKAPTAAAATPAPKPVVKAPAPAPTPTVQHPAIDDPELAALLAGTTKSMHVATPEVPAAPPAPKAVTPVAVPPTSHDLVSASDDFIEDDLVATGPDLDDAQRLELFIKELDPSTPDQVRVASAHAFLRALGKDAKGVIGGIENKIQRLRDNAGARDGELRAQIAGEQATIDKLQSQIDAAKARLAGLQGQASATAQLTADDEARVRALRQFFKLT